MKIRPLILLIAVVVLVMCPLSVAFAVIQSTIFTVGENQFFKNGQTEGIEMDTVPFIKQGRTYVPVRFLGQSLGISAADIQWDSVGRQAILVKGSQSVILTVAKDEIIVNGKTKKIDAAPLLKDGRVYLPARFVAEVFDHRVTWNAVTQTVAVSPAEQDKTGGAPELKAVEQNVVIVDVAAGWFHTLALDNSGYVWTWGDNFIGQLGDGTIINQFAPQRLNLPNIIAITAGRAHTVVLDSAGRVWAWGLNINGQLGDGQGGDLGDYSAIPQLINFTVADPVNIVALVAGSNHTVALDNQGTIWTWGDNWSGQLGNATKIRELRPVRLDLPNLPQFVAITAGASHTAALDSEGKVWTWGLNAHGQLGDGQGGTLNAYSDTPQRLNLTGITAITAGRDYTIVLDSEGAIWTWGDNWSGQLGDGTMVRQLTPQRLDAPDLPDFTAVTAGCNHTAALDAGGRVWMWGLNTNGQLGDGTTVDKHAPRCLSLHNITAVAAGGCRGTVRGGHTVAVDDQGQVWTWGANWSGQLGSGITERRLFPGRIIFKELCSAKVEI